jgi:hypothetical protein
MYTGKIRIADHLRGEELFDTLFHELSHQYGVPSSPLLTAFVANIRRASLAFRYLEEFQSEYYATEDLRLALIYVRTFKSAIRTAFLRNY